MVYAHKVCRVTFSGTMWGGAEEWSTGMFLGQENEDSAPPTQTSTEALAAHFRTAFVAANAYISGSYSFTVAKTASIAVEGTTIEDEVFYAPPLTAAVGGNGAVRLPSQCALALTMYSQRPRGKAAKGRMYLPGVAVQPGTDGYLPASNAGFIIDVWEDFFNAVKGDTDIPDVPILAAKGTGLFPALTAQNDYIIGLKLGNVIDTQRRRRNGLSETYLNRLLA